MKTIKLRLRDAHTHQIVGYEKTIGSEWYKSVDGRERENGVFSSSGNAVVRELWTGLTDITGKDIYEHDTVLRRRQQFKSNGKKNGSEQNLIYVIWKVIGKLNGFNLTSARHCRIVEEEL